MSLKTSSACGLEVGRDDDLGEDVPQVLGHLQGDRAVGRDHAAERRDRVALVRAQVRAGDRVERVRRGDGDAARVGVLDDRDGGLDHVERGAQRGIRVDVVVVRHLLALQLRGLRDAVPADAGVDRGALVRVLAVAQRREALGLDREVLRQVARSPRVLLGEPRRDGAVVARTCARRRGRRARGAASRVVPPVGDRVDDRRVRLGRDDDRDVRVVLRRGAHHRGAADVDLLDDVVALGARRDGLDERVQVHHDELERLDAELGELALVVLEAQVGEQSGVHAGVQRLDPPVERLGEAGDRGDIRHRVARRRGSSPRSTRSRRSRRPRRRAPRRARSRSVLSLTETSARRIGHDVAVAVQGRVVAGAGHGVLLGWGSAWSARSGGPAARSSSPVAMRRTTSISSRRSTGLMRSCRRVLVVAGEHRHALLREDRPAVDAVVDDDHARAGLRRRPRRGRRARRARRGTRAGTPGGC